MLFNLYKKRDFGAYISDTIQFFKQYWKNYFINFVSLNGALLIILCLIYYFIFKDFFAQMLSNPGSPPTLFYDENMGISVTLIVIGMLVAVIFTIITTAYPISYLRLVEKTDRETFTAGEVLNEIKKDIGKIIIFGLLGLVTFVPILTIYFLISAVLCILLIGIPLFIFGMGAALTWMSQTLYVYLNEENTGFFDAMGAGWRILFSKFWHIAGTSTAMVFIVQTLAGVVSMVPYFIGLGKMLSSSKSGEPDIEGFMPWMIVFYVINVVLTYILQNFIYINQGLIYYSNKEEQEHLQAYSEIDTIGKNEE